MEIMVPNVAIRNLIRENKIHQIYGSMQVGQEKYGNADAQSVAPEPLHSPLHHARAGDRSVDRARELKNMIENANAKMGGQAALQRPPYR